MTAKPATPLDAEKLKQSALVASMLFYIRVVGIPEPELEYEFCPDRDFRLDLAWPPCKLYVECDGGTWIGGRHTRGGGYAKDCKKRNLAIIMGWRGLHFTTEMFDDGYAIETLERAFKALGCW